MNNVLDFLKDCKIFYLGNFIFQRIKLYGNSFVKFLEHVWQYVHATGQRETESMAVFMDEDKNPVVDTAFLWMKNINR